MAIAKPGESTANGSIEPISVRIPAAVAMTGLSRSRIYELIASGEIQIAKDRRSTLLIVASLREVVSRRIVDRDLPAE
ncbi:MAG: AlpA family phage regulatory protein [Sphingomonas sp.]|uniref:AlpA family phage regulatory protein n=1 Tax=Sphingomonas sp. TaxID=28214 RepID=UPI002273B6DE|nr:AlpA family phage regulatory protein [Sphingomonas sp.]MCX8475855.1 AlpA family phage regulatory protein [Sphingomonas sp.]